MADVIPINHRASEREMERASAIVGDWLRSCNEVDALSIAYWMACYAARIFAKASSPARAAEEMSAITEMAVSDENWEKRHG